MANIVDLIEAYTFVYGKWVLYVHYTDDEIKVRAFQTRLEQVLIKDLGDAGRTVWADIVIEGFSVFSDSSECAAALESVRKVVVLPRDRANIYAVTYGPRGGIDEL